MAKTSKLKAILQSDWMIAFFILAVFLLTNGYIYGWDDQHLEIPLLKSLIDKTLYAGDYYVESLKTHFVSYLYPLLAKLIRVEQIPGVYLFLYLVSRYFLFFWAFKIWRHISASRVNALACVLTAILVWRTEEFLYRTFSHQEFALALIFAGLYLFYKNRFVWAALILGITANFHALYSLYPMVYMLAYLTWQVREHGWKTMVSSGLVYWLTALPLLIWAFTRVVGPDLTANVPPSEWIPFYHIACPQNFIFYNTALADLFKDWPTALTAFKPFLPFLSLLLLNLVHNPHFRKDKKVISITFVSLLFFCVSFVFTYLYPLRLTLDLNLIRGIQYLHFFLGGYTALLLLRTLENEEVWLGFIITASFVFLSLDEITAALAGMFMFFILWFPKIHNQKNPMLKFSLLTFIVTGIILCIGGEVFLNQPLAYPFRTLLKLTITAALLLILLIIIFVKERKAKNPGLRRAMIFIPILVMFCFHIQHHRQYLKMVRNNAGYWRLQNDWEDMQRYAKNNTPKDALFLTPYDTEVGGFRILSERGVIGCYRDCGIIGFDYMAAKEWRRRIADIWAFKVILDRNADLKSALLNAIVKYKVNYIVFMRYYAPPHDQQNLQKVYENQTFILFKVNR